MSDIFHVSSVLLQMTCFLLLYSFTNKILCYNKILVVEQYTLKMSENMKQDVTSDPNENVVEYHISDPGQETWIVNDFGKVRQFL